MSKITVGKAKRGRLWHIVEWDISYCGKKVEINWMYSDYNKELRLCSRCAEGYESLLAKSEVKDYGDEPVKPNKKTNPHSTW